MANLAQLEREVARLRKSIASLGRQARGGVVRNPRLAMIKLDTDLSVLTAEDWASGGGLLTEGGEQSMVFIDGLRQSSEARERQSTEKPVQNLLGELLLDGTVCGVFHDYDPEADEAGEDSRAWYTIGRVRRDYGIFEIGATGSGANIKASMTVDSVSSGFTLPDANTLRIARAGPYWMHVNLSLAASGDTTLQITNTEFGDIVVSTSSPASSTPGISVGGFFLCPGNEDYQIELTSSGGGTASIIRGSLSVARI